MKKLNVTIFLLILLSGFLLNNNYFGTNILKKLDSKLNLINDTSANNIEFENPYSNYFDNGINVLLKKVVLKISSQKDKLSSNEFNNFLKNFDAKLSIIKYKNIKNTNVVNLVSYLKYETEKLYIDDGIYELNCNKTGTCNDNNDLMDDLLENNMSQGIFNENGFDEYNFDGNNFDGNNFDGNNFDGNSLDGNSFDGNSLDGNSFDGNSFNGNSLDGNNFNGNSFDGNSLDGNSFDGNSSDGNNTNETNINNKILNPDKNLNDGIYILRDDKDYDGDGKIMGCNEKLNGYDRKKCILFNSKNNIYLMPSLKSSRNNYNNAVNYCNSLNVGGISNWILPEIDMYLNNQYNFESKIYDLDSGTYWTITKNKSHYYTYDFLERKKSSASGLLHKRIICVSSNINSNISDSSISSSNTSDSSISSSSISSSSISSSSISSSNNSSSNNSSSNISSSNISSSNNSSSNNSNSNTSSSNNSNSSTSDSSTSNSSTSDSSTSDSSTSNSSTSRSNNNIKPEEKFKNGIYVLRDDKDYDGNGRIMGCNEKLDGYDRENCILFNVNKSYYLMPSIKSSKKNYIDANQYCKDLEVGGMSNWVLPNLDIYTSSEYNFESRIYDLNSGDYWTNTRMNNEYYTYDFIMRKKMLVSQKLLKRTLCITSTNDELNNINNNSTSTSTSTPEEDKKNTSSIKLIDNSNLIFKKILNDGTYYLRDDVDYDGNGKNSGCKEVLEGFDKNKCILYITKSNILLAPVSSNIQQIPKDAESYCKNLVVGENKDWFLPSYLIFSRYLSPNINNIYYRDSRYCTSTFDYGYMKILAFDGRYSGGNHNTERNVRCISYAEKAPNPCMAETCFSGVNTGYYVIYNNKDYDGNNSYEGCNEDLLGYDKSKCILYDENAKFYIMPKIDSSISNYGDAISYCNDLDVGGISNWYVPKADTYSNYLKFHKSKIYNLQDNDYWTIKQTEEIIDGEIKIVDNNHDIYNFSKGTINYTPDSTLNNVICVASNNYTSSNACFRDVRWYTDSKCKNLTKTRDNWGPANSTHEDGSFFCNANGSRSPYWNGGVCTFKTIETYVRY